MLAEDRLGKTNVTLMKVRKSHADWFNAQSSGHIVVES
jgi:hypothetical protein